MHFRGFPVLVSVLALSLMGGGCLVMGSKFESKAREADSLRDAVAMTSREKSALEARIEILENQVASEKARNDALSVRFLEQEEALRRAGSELSQTRKSYEGTRITREQLVAELLEKEKATGKRIQELSLKVAQCEAEAERSRKEILSREAALAEAGKAAQTSRRAEELREERDLLRGRVERLLEERRLLERQRGERFATLSESLRKKPAGVSTAVLGPAFRLFLPAELVARQGSELSDGCRAAVAAVGKAAAEFPTASLIILADSPEAAGALKAAIAAGAKVPDDRIVSSARGKDKGAEILLLVP